MRIVLVCGCESSINEGEAFLTYLMIICCFMASSSMPAEPPMPPIPPIPGIPGKAMLCVCC